MTGEPSDADLVRRSLDGDAKAFGLLARRHGPRLARVARALGVHASEVEDVVQTALLAAWRALADYDPSRPFLTWASTITANKARDWTRKRRTRRWWSEGEPLGSGDALALADPLGDPALVERRAELREIERRIRELPDGLAVPFVLATVLGMSQPEIGQALGLSVRAVESRIAKVRRRLAG